MKNNVVKKAWQRAEKNGNSRAVKESRLELKTLLKITIVAIETRIR